ncbi:hypothetical protein MOA67_gp140 [Klebsiella phage KpLz-2_45]|uniref:hypothetical protein n=1 Tax=Klebsiella phage KpLz-2_45 TaxID=2698923 RepID=UPI001F12C992|nr:hypothetical protein MOA67_gp140 [Klebsiella phage KpLz-2_45]UKS72006.1 hypothetical protein KpLz245_1400 [Klebsiella phage KpLz-2_45]
MRFKESEAGEILLALERTRESRAAENLPYIQVIRAEVRGYDETVKTLAAKKVVKFLGYTPMIIPELVNLTEKLEQPNPFPIYIGNETLFESDLNTVIGDSPDENQRG